MIFHSCTLPDLINKDDINWVVMKFIFTCQVQVHYPN